ncbi:DegV family protein with EDD domain [Herbinix hemicellulosilytica]|uniref:DegV domain-containing protein YitS n=1 Tax=Herbinix hemicellulosilytica TaxID=1564487 RepID=A0A0H5SF00_HERHM|nr:DegV family protein [Herbinix hemicellulosilytica]RBP56178.1 DegV family protein with EDD domain [Herbinix hemicellulosilytica]CRZ33436.1 DegV domain-containing protein YitS [Herbinix hemicellulosilytica]
MALKIITDSASDIPKWVIEEYGLHIIPTPVVIDDKDYFDGKTIFPEEFYDILRSGKDIKTYHINSQMFYDNFLSYAKNGDELIYICFSTGIAGTYNAANIAKAELLEEYPDFDLTIIDSKCASMGFGLATYYALKMQKAGASKEEIIEAINWYCDHMEHIFTVKTLEYLLKGGRISKTSAVAGSLLDIKPIIQVNDLGALEPIEKVRGRQKSLKRLVEIVGERGKDLTNQVIGIVHGDDAETMEAVKEMLKDTYGCRHFIDNYVGCAIGAHTGPGIIGIVFLDEESPYKHYTN